MQKSGNTGKEIRVLSLFSGCGGMDLGLEGGFTVDKNSINETLTPEFIKAYVSDNLIELEGTKFLTVFANDILKEAKTAWVHHFSKLGYDGDVYHSESIVDLVKLHNEGFKIFPDNIDVVTGGFPCQDFSVSGKRGGFNSSKSHTGLASDIDAPSSESRGQLYTWMKEVIEIVKPKIFIAENVKGMISLDNVKEIIQKDFASAHKNGYIVLSPKVLHAANYGVPQSRERIIFIGIKKSALNKKALSELSKKRISKEYDPYPRPTHSYNCTGSKLSSPQTLSNVFALLKEPEVSDDASQMFYSRAKYMGSHCQGQTEVNLNGISPTIRSEHHGNIEYRRLSKEHGGKNLHELEEGMVERRLTPRECALIQTFPVDYEFVIPSNKYNTKFFLSPSAAYRIIGNAVPPLLAYHIGKRIEKLWPLYFN